MEKTTDQVQRIDQPGPDGDLWGWAGPGWYFWDETKTVAQGPYGKKSGAELALANYAQALTALQAAYTST